MTIEQIRKKFIGAYVASYEKAQKNIYGEYMSDRHDEDIPLVCQELNIVTVEDYDKWYGLYYLMEDPDSKEIMLVKLCHGNNLEGIDHEYYPDSVIDFCKLNDIKIDTMSFLCINKSLLSYDKNIHYNHLASLHNTTGIVISKPTSFSRTFHLDGRYDVYTGYTVEASVFSTKKEYELRNEKASF